MYMKALTNFEKIMEKARVLEVPMYRSKFWMQKEQEKAKDEKRESWYKKGDYKTVLFVYTHQMEHCPVIVQMFSKKLD